MKKEKYCSVFMTTLMIAIPAGAIIALLFDVFGKALFAEYGSFMAGIIGFAGVAWLVLNQNKETKKILDSNMAMVKNEAFEAQRSKAVESVTKLSYKLSLLMGESKQSFHMWHTELPGKYFFKGLKSELYFLDAFLSIYDKEEITVLYQDCIRNFLNVYENQEWEKIVEFNSSRKIFSRLLSVMVVLNSTDQQAIEKTANVFYVNPYVEDAPIDGPYYVYKNFDQLNEYEVSRFVIKYMLDILIPLLVNSINNLER